MAWGRMVVTLADAVAVGVPAFVLVVAFVPAPVFVPLCAALAELLFEPASSGAAPPLTPPV